MQIQLDDLKLANDIAKKLSGKKNDSEVEEVDSKDRILAVKILKRVLVHANDQQGALKLESRSLQYNVNWYNGEIRKFKRKLKEICSAKIALKHRLLPLSFGDGSELVETEDPNDASNTLPQQPGGEDEQEANESTSDQFRLRIATYDPFNYLARQAASQAINYPIEWTMASRTKILQGIQELYGVGADTFEQILAGRDLDMESLDIDKDEANVLDEDEDEEASVDKFGNQIIREALDQRATDIHVEPLHSDLRIRYRIDGLLHDVAVPENISALQSSVIARLKIMSKLDIAERRLPQDGRINLSLEDQQIDVRVATIPTVEGESVSLRLLNQEKFNLDRLGLIEHTRSRVDQLLSMSNGIILITGPTGSGKSTTLYTFLSELNTSETRIVTIEDPVENKLDGVMQIAVKPEIDLTFGRGLRSILRGDPNIVMIGEMRDLETAEIAVRASLTGHLVFSTLHTNDAIGGISRLTDMGVEPFLVSASVRAFLAQRLVRRLCPSCKVPHEYTQEHLDSIDFPKGEEGQMFVANEGGCDRCRNSGYLGRLAIYEICLVTPAIEDLIVTGASSAEIKQKATEEGFINMRNYGWYKVLSGDTTLEEVMSATTVELKIEG